ncbi:MAG: hypothetical protein ABIR68_19725 [Ilumatobacteraceae bacterium]
MSGEGPDRIELIDDEPVGEPAPGQRRSHPPAIVAFVVLAVIVVIAVVAASWDSSQNAHTPTTSTTPTTTAAPGRSSPTTVDAQQTSSAARMVGVLPDGFRPYLANILNGNQGSTHGGQLWAGDDHPASDQPWFIVTPTTTDTALAGTMRLPTAVGVAVIRLSADGDLTIGPIPGGQLAIQSSGLDIDQLARVLAATTIVNGDVTVDASAAPSGFGLVTTADPGASLAWSPFITTAARSTNTTDQPDGDLAVAVGPPLDDAQRASEQFFTTGDQLIAVDGLPASIGTDTRNERRTISFERNGLHVVVSGREVDDRTLTTYAASLRTVGDDDWYALQRQAASTPPLLTHTHSGALTHLTGASLNSNATWDIRVGHTTTGIAVETLENQSDGPGAATDTELAGNGPAITATGLPSLTAIVAAVPATMSGAVLRVHTPVSTIETPFAASPDLDPGDALFATTTFTEPGNYTAEIIAADGTIVATFDPTTTRAG